jgi:hypothetical protein
MSPPTMTGSCQPHGDEHEARSRRNEWRASQETFALGDAQDHGAHHLAAAGSDLVDMGVGIAAEHQFVTLDRHDAMQHELAVGSGVMGDHIADARGGVAPHDDEIAHHDAGLHRGAPHRHRGEGSTPAHGPDPDPQHHPDDDRDDEPHGDGVMCGRDGQTSAAVSYATTERPCNVPTRAFSDETEHTAASPEGSTVQLTEAE